MDRGSIFKATIEKALSPVAAYRSDPTVSEIMINGPAEIYVERRGIIERTDVAFESEDALLALARNIAQFTHTRLTETTSRFDSRLPDGSRVHVVMPRCSRKGLCIAIRQFAPVNLSLSGLVKSRSLTSEAKEYLELLVELERNFIVSGGTGAGKTSFLNAISLQIPSHERIIVIEDTAELQLQQPHVLSLEAVPPDRFGQGAVTIRDLFHSALRMRPDRIVIGECRGGEALDLIQALTSGHGGSMSTLHANSGTDALHRIETMALMSGVQLPLFALRAQVSSAIHAVVQLERLAGGFRAVTEISEVVGLDDNGGYSVNAIFALAPTARRDGHSFTLQPTGNTSIFSETVRMKNLQSRVELTSAIFNTAN